MRNRAVILIVLIVILPLGLLTWAGTRIAASEQQDVRQRFRSVMEQRLQDVNAVVAAYFSEVERDMLKLTALDNTTTDRLREINRTEPRLLQLFVLSANGNLRYPDPTQPLNNGEQSFLLRASKMFTDQDLKSVVALSVPEIVSRQSSSPAQRPDRQLRGDADPQPVLPSDETDAVAAQPIPFPQAVQQPPSATAVSATSGWFVWYWDRGLHLVYWQRRPSGEIIGVALERARWIAELIGRLPDTQPAAGLSADSGTEGAELRELVRLVDAASDVIYQWGSADDFTESENAKNVVPFCEIAVAAPLSSWRLQCFVPMDQLKTGARSSVYLSLMGGLVTTAAGLAALAAMLYRDYARDMREAAQQVSFVNQVSHELKTPLTNIRMYAELLETDLQAFPSDETIRPQQRLEVILSEGQRLSRLISNVLSFARHKRNTLQPKMSRHVPDELLTHIVDRFRPSLAALGITPAADFQAGEPVMIDPDFLEQILGNLISNVEKYAAAGGSLQMRSRLVNGLLSVEVIDRGPGIAAFRQAEMFRPFTRLSSELSSAAGTGIGLSIARELSRLHGGDLTLVEGGKGCCFRMELAVSAPGAPAERDVPGRQPPASDQGASSS